jgi:hypothetical protein
LNGVVHGFRHSTNLQIADVFNRSTEVELQERGNPRAKGRIVKHKGANIMLSVMFHYQETLFRRFIG